MENPTVQHEAQYTMVQQDLLEAVMRFSEQGFDPRTVVAGLAMVSMQTIATLYGEAEVPVWFAKQSALTMHLAKPKDG